jgi:hypothetical protein
MIFRILFMVNCNRFVYTYLDCFIHKTCQKVNMSRCSILTLSELLLLLLVFMVVRIACSSVLPRLFDVHHSSNTCFIQHRKCNNYFVFCQKSFLASIGQLSDQRHSNNIFCILTNISVLFGLI